MNNIIYLFRILFIYFISLKIINQITLNFLKLIYSNIKLCLLFINNKFSVLIAFKEI